MRAMLPVLGLCLLVLSVHSAFAQAEPSRSAKTISSSAEQELIALSKDKWRWTAERNV